MNTLAFIASAVAILAVLVCLPLTVRVRRLSRAEVQASAARAAAAESRATAAEAHSQAATTRAVSAEQQHLALVGELTHLAKERLPVAAAAPHRPHVAVPGPLDPRLADSEVGQALTGVLDAALAEVAGERERVDAAARATMRGSSARVQALLHQNRSLLQQVQQAVDDPRLLELDFRNEVALRRIQATAVLCGAWPGLTRADSPLAEVVVGAVSRVLGYERVRTTNHVRDERLAVVARFAEPLAIALAELLANATAYSAPDIDVPVTLQQRGGHGVLITVDDCGIGMDDDALSRARHLLAGPETLLLTELGDPPQTGLAVVGRLCRQYGFTAHIEPSPYGGMRVLLSVPAHLLTSLEDERQLSALAPSSVHATEPAGAVAQAAAPVPVPAPVESDSAEQKTELPQRKRRSPVRASAAPRSAPARTRPRAVSADTAAADTEDEEIELPRRKRRTPVAAPARADVRQVAEAAPAEVSRSAEQARSQWGALQRGTQEGRHDAAPPADSPGRTTDTAPEGGPL